METAKGTLIVTTFTSLAYEDHFKKASTFAEHTDKGRGGEETARPGPPVGVARGEGRLRHPRRAPSTSRFPPSASTSPASDGGDQ